MAKRKKFEKNKAMAKKEKGFFFGFSLPEEIKRLIWGAVLLLAAVIIALSFFGLAGGGGRFFMKSANFLLGKAAFSLPLVFLLGGIAFFIFKYKNNKWPIILAIFLLIIGISGIFGTFDQQIKQGGWIGYLVSQPVLKIFDKLAAQIIFAGLMFVGSLIFWQFLYRPSSLPAGQAGANDSAFALRASAGKSVIKKIFGPKFKVK